MSNRELVIGFDADDTLWHNEIIFEKVHQTYRELLAQYHGAETIEEKLFEVEMRNLELYGYGVKGFTLSAIETAIDLTAGKIAAEEVRQLIQLGKDMLDHPVELLDGVAETLAELSRDHRLVLITKGDLLDQERKLSKSGLAAHFRHVEIVSEKNEETYAGIFRRHQIDPCNFLMVGNSLKSDIVPVLRLGGAGAHIRYHLTWAAEQTDEVPAAEGRLFQLSTVSEVSEVITFLRKY